MRLDPPTLIADARRRSGLSRAAFAHAAGTSRAAIDQIEKGERTPRTDTLLRAVGAAGLAIEVELVPTAGPPDGADPGEVTLAAASTHLDPSDPQWSWRWLISDFVANEFVPAGRRARARSLVDEPRPTGDPRWDTFLAALAEHLAWHAGLPIPTWTAGPTRAPLAPFWWPVHGELRSMRAAAMSCSPASFKGRGILLDGRELPVVVP